MQSSKFIVGGGLIVAAVIYLIASSTRASAEYFLTVEELQARADSMVGKSLRLSGAVIGDTIAYDPQSLTLTFEIAHVPGDQADIEDEGGLAEVLHAAVTDSSRPRVRVLYVGPKPDLLRDEAQAIMTGSLQQDGVFHADELLLKCPTRYEEAVPQQAASR